MAQPFVFSFIGLFSFPINDLGVQSHFSPEILLPCTIPLRLCSPFIVQLVRLQLRNLALSSAIDKTTALVLSIL